MTSTAEEIVKRNICGGNLHIVTEAAADDSAAEQRAHL